MDYFLFLTIIIFSFFLIIFAFGFFLSESGYNGPKSDHFNGKRFINPSGVPAKNLFDVLKYSFYRRPDTWVENNDLIIPQKQIFELPKDSKARIWFINHSSFLIQQAKMNLITDPVFSKRCSPFQFAGPKRQRPPGLNFSDLPKIDLVLISHNHYDHLDKNSINLLRDVHDPTFIVPLGVDNLLIKWGCQKVFALDWYDTHKFKNLTIKSIPANHFSARGMFDRDKTLWCGYQVLNDQTNIYFTGDTGYSNIFPELADTLQQPDISLIPIGAYLPRWFMSPIHISPEEAVQVHRDIKSKKSIAMHFGTFPLADDNKERAIADFQKALKNKQVDSDEFLILREGEYFSL